MIYKIFTSKQFSPQIDQETRWNPKTVVSRLYELTYSHIPASTATKWKVAESAEWKVAHFPSGKRIHSLFVSSANSWWWRRRQCHSRQRFLSSLLSRPNSLFGIGTNVQMPLSLFYPANERRRWIATNWVLECRSHTLMPKHKTNPMLCSHTNKAKTSSSNGGQTYRCRMRHTSFVDMSKMCKRSMCSRVYCAEAPHTVIPPNSSFCAVSIWCCVKISFTFMRLQGARGRNTILRGIDRVLYTAVTNTLDHPYMGNGHSSGIYAAEFALRLHKE